MADSCHGLDRITEAFIYDEGDEDEDDDYGEDLENGYKHDNADWFAVDRYTWADVPLPTYTEANPSMTATL